MFEDLFSFILGLTRQNELAQKVLTDNDGFSVLMRAMQTDIEKLKIKSAFMLSSFVVDKPQFKGNYINGTCTYLYLRLQ